MVFATQRLENTRYITKTGESIASQRLGIPKQRLKWRFPATTETKLLDSEATLGNVELKTKDSPWKRCCRTTPGRST
jgi:hypothetical protein